MVSELYQLLELQEKGLERCSVFHYSCCLTLYKISVIRVIS